MEQKEENGKPNLFCEICNFQAVRPAEFIKHVATNKHQRNGEKLKEKIFRCDDCDKVLVNNFTYKIHMIQIHGTLEAKLKQKYYCQSCDTVFISKLYMDKHNSGKKHNNILRSIELLKEIKQQKEKLDRNKKLTN